MGCSGKGLHTSIGIPSSYFVVVVISDARLCQWTVEKALGNIFLASTSWRLVTSANTCTERKRKIVRSCRAKLLLPPKAVPQSCSTKLFPKAAPQSCYREQLQIAVPQSRWSFPLNQTVVRDPCSSRGVGTDLGGIESPTDPARPYCTCLMVHWLGKRIIFLKNDHFFGKFPKKS